MAAQTYIAGGASKRSRKKRRTAVLSAIDGLEKSGSGSGASKTRGTLKNHKHNNNNNNSDDNNNNDNKNNVESVNMREFSSDARSVTFDVPSRVDLSSKAYPREKHPKAPANINRVEDDSKSMYRKIAMATLDVRADNSYVRFPVLFDTGAFPHSYVSIGVVQELGLLNNIVEYTAENNTAQKGDKFRSIGDVDVEFRLPNKHTFTGKFRVADISTEFMFGLELLKQLGAVIDLNREKITLVKCKKCKVPLLSRNDWTSVSNV